VSVNTTLPVFISVKEAESIPEDGLPAPPLLKVLLP